MNTDDDRLGPEGSRWQSGIHRTTRAALVYALLAAVIDVCLSPASASDAWSYWIVLLLGPPRFLFIPENRVPLPWVLIVSIICAAPLIGSWCMREKVPPAFVFLGAGAWSGSVVLFEFYCGRA